MLIPLFLLLLQSPTEPRLDGTITAGEWDRAVRHRGSNGLEVSILRTGSAVYVAVRGSGEGFPHVALMREDTVLLLHASAALGTARYVATSTGHRLMQPFSFSVRATALEGEAQRERDAFFEREGWVATTMHMGSRGETEFKIASDLLRPGGPISVAFWSPQSGTLAWPAAGGDAVSAERMVQGHLSEEATFRINRWSTAE